MLIELPDKVLRAMLRQYYVGGRGRGSIVQSLLSIFSCSKYQLLREKATISAQQANHIEIPFYISLWFLSHSMQGWHWLFPGVSQLLGAIPLWQGHLDTIHSIIMEAFQTQSVFCIILLYEVFLYLYKVFLLYKVFTLLYKVLCSCTQWWTLFYPVSAVVSASS